MKHIHWLIPYKIYDKNKITNVNIASVRLRAGLFLHDLFKDFDVTFNEDISNINEIDILCVGKFAANRENLLEQWLNYINYLRKNKTKIIFDYTDHHLSKNTLASKFYNKALKESDYIVTSSKKLKTHLKSRFKNIIIIEDPIEINMKKIKKNKKSSFLFFGHQSNLDYLFKLIPLWDTSKEYKLIIQSSDIGLKKIQEQSQFIKKPNNLHIELQNWSVPNMIEAAEQSSGIIIPGDINDDRKNGVSHNRLITSFALGLPVAATKYDSYLEFEHQFADIDNNKEFTNFLINPSLFSSHTKMAQKKVEKYTAENLALKWLDLINYENI
tara:strand:+ start:257 stop:1237 length:981 start_codon:yes stop_codon:yes gene_type:complete